MNTESSKAEHGTVCQLISEHQIRLYASSSVISRPTCFSSSLRCCWQVGSSSFVRRRCDCIASSASIINVQTYLLTYLYPQTQFGEDRCTLFRVIVVTDPQTHTSTVPQTDRTDITIHCAAASAQCNGQHLCVGSRVKLKAQRPGWLVGTAALVNLSVSETIKPKLNCL